MRSLSEGLPWGCPICHTFHTVNSSWSSYYEQEPPGGLRKGDFLNPSLQVTVTCWHMLPESASLHQWELLGGPHVSCNRMMAAAPCSFCFKWAQLKGCLRGLTRDSAFLSGISHYSFWDLHCYNRGPPKANSYVVLIDPIKSSSFNFEVTSKNFFKKSSASRKTKNREKNTCMRFWDPHMFISHACVILYLHRCTNAHTYTHEFILLHGHSFSLW